MTTNLCQGFRLGLTTGLGIGQAIGQAIALMKGFAIASTTLLGTLTFSGNPAVSQITPDATLGAESSSVTPNVNIRGVLGDRIDGGAVRGTNLFHSFQEFNVGNGQRIYFANPTGIENILSRVTGNNLSHILGKLGVDGGANLFFLNPNGIIFGPNARLDIAGSLVVSTANGVKFNNGYLFSAKNPDAPPLLTVSVPLGVQYEANQPRTTIANTGTLAVGQNLTLDAGNLDLQGQLQAGRDLTLQAQETLKVRDSLVSPFVAASGEKLLVQGNQIVDIFALNHPNSGFFSGGDMVLRSPNAVMGDAHYTTGGNFRIEQLDGSLGDLDSPGDPVIRASGNVSFDSYQGASLHIFAGGSVNLGSVTITGADATNFINETVFLSQTLPDGTNTVTINGSTRLTLDIRAGTLAVGTPLGVTGNPTPTGLVLSDPPTSADIVIGTVTITQPNGLVFITNNYQPNLALTGNIQATSLRTDSDGGGFNGNSGDVIIDSRGNITLPNSARIQTYARTGNAGNVTLIANGSFLMNPSSQIQAVTAGRGNAGNVTIKVDGAVTLLGTKNPRNSADGTFIFANVESRGVGNGGEINIQAGSLSLIDGAQLQAIVRGSSGFLQPAGRGNAGNVKINVRDAIVISGADKSGQFGSAIFTSIEPGVTGNSGNINIQARTLSITDGGSIDATTYGQGNAGIITLDVRDITVAGVHPVSGFSSGIYIATYGGINAQAGKITTINTDKLRVANGAVLNASSYSSADGGEINVNANVVELTGGGQILALPYAQGNGGNVTLNVSEHLTISGNDSTFETRFLEFGPDVVTNQGGASGVFTGYGLGASAARQNIPVDSTGNAGNISIIGSRELNIDGGQLFTGGFNSGNGGNLSITQAGAVNLANVGLIVTSTFGTGNAGSLSIDIGKLSLQNQSLITSSTAGAGDAGGLNIRASDFVEVLSGSRIVSETVGSGRGGDLTVDTRRLITRNGDISASAGTKPTLDGDTVIFTPSSGRSGNLTVRASESVDIGGEAGTPIGGLFTSTFGYGQGGDLSVETGRLTVQDGGRIEAGTFGLGQGGTVRVNALGSIELIGTSADGTRPSGISAYSRPPLDVDANLWQGSANSGGVNLNTQDLVIRDGAEVTTAVEGRSQTGNAGNVQVQANSLSLTEGGRITSRSEGRGDAGDITANVRGNLRSRNGIISATSAQAGGGDIKIEADDIHLRESSLISTSVFDSTGGGGNISINSTIFVALEDSDILANAADGRGGNITIISEAFLTNLFFRHEATPVGRNPGDFSRFRGNNRVDISVDSKTGPSGILDAPEVFSPRGLAPLPLNLVNASEQIDRRCTPTSKARGSSFTVTGTGGLPPSPNDPLRNDEVWVDWINLEERDGKRDNSAADTNTKFTPSHPQQLVEAQGWVIGADGKVILTAAAPTVTPESPGLELPPCEDNQAVLHRDILQ